MAAAADRDRAGEAEAGRLPLGGLEVPGAGAEPPQTGLVLTATGISFAPGLHSWQIDTNQVDGNNISPILPFQGYECAGQPSLCAGSLGDLNVSDI